MKKARIYEMTQDEEGPASASQSLAQEQHFGKERNRSQEVKEYY